MTACGPSRHSGALQQFGRFLSEADTSRRWAQVWRQVVARNPDDELGRPAKRGNAGCSPNASGPLRARFRRVYLRVRYSWPSKK